MKQTWTYKIHPDRDDLELLGNVPVTDICPQIFVNRTDILTAECGLLIIQMSNSEREIYEEAKIKSSSQCNVIVILQQEVKKQQSKVLKRAHWQTHFKSHLRWICSIAMFVVGLVWLNVIHTVGRRQRRNPLLSGKWVNCPECIIFQEVEPPQGPTDLEDSINRLMLYSELLVFCVWHLTLHSQQDSPAQCTHFNYLNVLLLWTIVLFWYIQYNISKDLLNRFIFH